MIEETGQVPADNALADAESAEVAAVLPADDAGEGRDEEVVEAQEEPKPEKPKRSGVQERIDELTRDKYTLLQDRDYWRQKALEVEKPKAEPEKPPTKPKSEDFLGDTDSYVEALSQYTEQLVEWKTKQATKELTERQKAELEARKKAESQQEVQTRWMTKVEEARAKLDSFDAIALNPNISVNETMAEVIMASDTGPDILYHLGKFPEKAARIAAMAPAQAAAALGRLEAEVLKPPKPPKASNAPPPPKPVEAGSSGTSKDPSKMSMKEYEAWRDKSSRN